ncbi:MAG TPA: DUF4079 domain-containing protein [Coleofasciculaceae cyanobacterium]|jgi:hypothetical protein
MSLAIPESVKVWSQFIHPIIMWVLLATAIYALYLGLKIRQSRNVEGEAKKELIKGRYNVKHYQVGSVLLAVLTLNAFLGMAVTYINKGKIFFGSHLIVGLTMVSLIVTSASLSPFMQRGNMWARNLHLALNIGVLGLFGWQAITGVQVVQKMISQL